MKMLLLRTHRSVVSHSSEISPKLRLPTDDRIVLLSWRLASTLTHGARSTI